MHSRKHARMAVVGTVAITRSHSGDVRDHSGGGGGSGSSDDGCGGDGGGGGGGSSGGSGHP